MLSVGISYLRRIDGITGDWIEIKFLEKVGIQNLLTELEKKLLKWFDYAKRTDKSRMLRKVREWNLKWRALQNDPEENDSSRY